MPHINIEIKAKTSNQDEIKKFLEENKTDYKGEDHQIDIYFNVLHGRLKLRKGTIENYLVQYNRTNQEGPKQSNVTLFKSDVNSELEKILTNALGVLVVVNKKRKIYFIDNVKFHLDKVQGLFEDYVEIEAIDYEGNIGKEKLLEQCNKYMKLLGIEQKDLVDCSYSDLLLRK